MNKSKRKMIHIDNLAKLFGLTPEFTCFLYKHLKRIEVDGHRIAERYCNGELDSEQVKHLEERLRANLKSTLKYARSEVVKNIKFNFDPRGYFLKLNDEYVRVNQVNIETDWGGFGVICPEGI